MRQQSGHHFQRRLAKLAKRLAETKEVGRRTKAPRRGPTNGDTKVQSSKSPAGASAVGRGLRTERIGEAAHPGPSGQATENAETPATGAVKIISYNINSANCHFDAVLDAAKESKAQIVCLQETKITQNSIPSYCHALRRYGWFWVVVSAVSGPKSAAGRSGGVAILCKEPLYHLLRYPTAATSGDNS